MQRLHSKNAFSNKMPWSVNKDKTENENPPTDQTMRMENEEKNKTWTHSPSFSWLTKKGSERLWFWRIQNLEEKRREDKGEKKKMMVVDVVSCYDSW